MATKLAQMDTKIDIVCVVSFLIYFRRKEIDTNEIKTMGRIRAAKEVCGSGDDVTPIIADIKNKINSTSIAEVCFFLNLKYIMGILKIKKITEAI